MSPSNGNKQNTGHVSAFAARKQKVPIPTSNSSRELQDALIAGGDEVDSSNAAKKRRRTLATATNRHSDLQRLRHKRRKKQNLAEDQSSLYQHPVANGAPSPRLPQASATVRTENVTSVSVENDRKQEDQTRHSNDGQTLRCVCGSEGEDGSETESQSQLDIGDQPAPGSADGVTPTDRQLSTFVPSEKNVVNSSGTEWTISIQEGESVTLVGQYGLWIRRGAVSLAGAVLHQSSTVYNVYAPSTQSLPSICPIRNPFGPSEQQTIVTVLQYNSGLRLLRHVSPRFGHIWNQNTAYTDYATTSVSPLRRTFQFLATSSDDAYRRPLRLLEYSNDWQILISNLTSHMQTQTNQPKTVLVCGPKGSGKSTFSHLLTNAILSRPSISSDSREKTRSKPCVALLDIDPGQPEFSPPGEISLVRFSRFNFGPPFTHPAASTRGAEMMRAHHIGAVTPRDDPKYYVQCVLNLFQHYKHLLAQGPYCPLVVNTAGWIQGSGLEILIDFIRYTSPTDVVYTSTQGPPEAVGFIARASNEVKSSLHFLGSQQSDVSPKSAAELRKMQILSYFHLDEPENGNLRWNAKPINERTPLRVHYAGPNQSIYGILLLGQDLDPEFIVQVLEGCIVGLVVIEDDIALPSLPETSRQIAMTAHESRNNNELLIDTPSPDSYDKSAGVLSRDDRGTISPTDRIIPASSLAQCEYISTGPCNYNHTPSLPRTSFQIPYIRSNDDLTPPLSPTYSHSLGQAFIQSVDATTQTITLITPIPISTFNDLHCQERKIVLVRGGLETPTWAYIEDLYMQMHRRKQAVKENLWEGELEAWGKEDTRRWAEGKPWVRVDGRGKGERVRRTRRDLGRRKVDRARNMVINAFDVCLHCTALDKEANGRYGGRVKQVTVVKGFA
ncbi:MAG: hypothetical protein Q9170_006603 [Blastenia crenularia]